jgi:hypothetical protein
VKKLTTMMFASLGAFLTVVLVGLFELGHTPPWVHGFMGWALAVSSIQMLGTLVAIVVRVLGESL